MKMYALWEIAIKDKAPYSLNTHKYAYKVPPIRFVNEKAAKIWIDAMIACWKKDTGYVRAEVVGVNFSGTTFVGSSDEGTDSAALQKSIAMEQAAQMAKGGMPR